MLDFALKAWKRLVTLRMRAWSPPLVAAVVGLWLFKFWRGRRRRGTSEVSVTPPVPTVDAAKFTPRGAHAERSAFLTGDGAYSHGEFAGGR